MADYPGFLGTHAPFVSDLTLILILLAAVLFTIGALLARRKHFKAHCWTQTITAVINATVVLVVMVRSFVKNFLAGVLQKPLSGFNLVITIHAIVGVIGLLLGIYVVLQAHKILPAKMRFRNNKLFMRISYALYMLATLIGVVVYLGVYGIGG